MYVLLIYFYFQTSTLPIQFPIPKSQLEYEDLIYRIGDIVKISRDCDCDDNLDNQEHEQDISTSSSTIYAQIRGFYRDQFCGKYASLQWIIPDPNSQPESDSNNESKLSLMNVMDVFDPAYFIQGIFLIFYIYKKKKQR